MMTKQEVMRYQNDFLENVRETAPNEVQGAYSRMHDAFEEYLTAIDDSLFEQIFRYGYERGFEAASRAKTA